MTPYELIQQQTLNRSLHDPLNEYADQLPEIARFQAQQRQQSALSDAEARAALERLNISKASAAALQAAEAKAALERVRVGGDLRIKEAEAHAKAVATAQVDQWDKKRKEAEKEGYRKLGINPNKGESDDDFLVRASQEADKVRASHLDAAYTIIQQKRDQAEAVFNKAAVGYQQRLQDTAWGAIRDQVDPKVRAQIEAVKDPTTKEQMIQGAIAAATGKGNKVLGLAYDDALTRARTMVPQLTPLEDSQIKTLTREADLLDQSTKALASRPEYAAALPEFVRLRGQGQKPAAAPAGAGTPPPGGGGASLDVIKAAAAKAGVAGVGAGKATAPTPATPDEIYSPSSTGVYGWGPGEERPLLAQLPEVDVHSAARAPYNAAWNAIDALGIGVNRLTGLPTGPNAAAMQERAAFNAPVPGNTTFESAYLSGMGLNPTTQAPIGAPTPAEILAFKAARDARLGRSARGVVAPPSEVSSVPGAAALPSSIGRFDQEQALLNAYQRRTAPLFDPTAVAGVAPFSSTRDIGPSAPTVRAAALPVMGPEDLRATRLRQTIRLKYPRTEDTLNLSVIPLPGLEQLYDSLERANAVPNYGSGPPVRALMPGIPSGNDFSRSRTNLVPAEITGY